jgi:tetratricopeptide (TPR) repeat protein
MKPSSCQFLVCIVFLFLFVHCQTNTNPKPAASKAQSINCISSSWHFPAEDSLSLSSALAALISELRCVYGSDKIPDFEPFLLSINRLADSLKREGPDTLCIGEFLHAVYGDWGIVFDSAQDSLGNMLPHMVVGRKRGSCLGVSLLFLLYAEKTGCPLHGVLLPTHFFVRYDNGMRQRNIEPNLGGFEHPDDYYRQRYGVTAGSWYSLRNLTKKEVLAVVWFNVANILQRDGHHREASVYYKRCLLVLDTYAETWGNLAISYDALGAVDSARLAFDRAARLRPDLDGLDRNRGFFEEKHGNFARAAAFFRAGLRAHSDDPRLQYGLALAYAGQGMRDTCFGILLELKASHPDFERMDDVNRLLSDTNAQGRTMR